MAQTTDAAGMAQFHSFGLRDGVWSGILATPAAPGRVMLIHRGQQVGQVALAAPGPDDKQGEWRVRATLPSEVLSDGTHTLLLIADERAADDPVRPGAQRLATLSIIAGEALEDDLRAELDLLRAELDLLKQEFRRLATGA